MAWTCPDGCCDVPAPSGVTDAMIEDAECRGLDDGIAAGSWITDGNTTEEQYRNLLDGIEAGDPEVMDALPSSPLSGEWADGLLPRDVLSWYDLTEDDNGSEDILRAYVDGFSRGVVAEVERSCRYQLAPES